MHASMAASYLVTYKFKRYTPLVVMSVLETSAEALPATTDVRALLTTIFLTNSTIILSEPHQILLRTQPPGLPNAQLVHLKARF